MATKSAYRLKATRHNRQFSPAATSELARGHASTVFLHDELQCPAFLDDEEPCGTYFVFQPFASRQEALDAFKPGSPQPRWAPWAAN